MHANSFIYELFFGPQKNIHVQLGGKSTNALNQKYHATVDLSISVTTLIADRNRYRWDGRHNLKIIKNITIKKYIYLI